MDMKTSASNYETPHSIAEASPPGEPGTPGLANYPLWHAQVLRDFNITPMVPALPDLALAPSYATFKPLAPALNFLWRRSCFIVLN